MKTWALGYEKAKAKAKQIYSAIGHVSCPAFGGELVAFTGVGFNHLVRKGRIPRTRNEQKKRFVLIPYIEKIIKNPRATIEYRRTTDTIPVNRRGEKILVESIAEFWTFVETVDTCTIKIVIRQLSTGGPKHFFSVMGDNVQMSKRNRRKIRHKKSRSK